jgi:hypothetical protein
LARRRLGYSQNSGRSTGLDVHKLATDCVNDVGNGRITSALNSLNSMVASLVARVPAHGFAACFTEADFIGANDN